MTKKYYGKYRGKVINNLDVRNLGRLLVRAPSVLGTHQAWAMPCVPYAGLNVGFLMTPPIAANVWIEFEGGNPNYPIWSGCFWGEGQRPKGLPTEQGIKTAASTFSLNDMPGAGNITLQIGPPATQIPLSIVLNSTGMTLEAMVAQLKLAPEAVALKLQAASVQLSPASVSINNGALEVI
jgi:hypothetical protein